VAPLTLKTRYATIAEKPISARPETIRTADLLFSWFQKAQQKDKRDLTGHKYR